MAGTGKEGKDKKVSKEESGNALLHRLADELAALRSDVELLKSTPPPPAPGVDTAPASEKRKGKKNATPSDTTGDTAADAWMTVEDTRVARLGYAFSSAPKVALIRALLQNGPQSAAQLGEQAGLTTGSLYHHLRELTHAEVIASENRNRFALTDYGRTSAQLLFTQAGHS